MSKKLKELSRITTRYENLNEWNDTSYKSLPKRWSKNVNDTRDGLTEMERNEGIPHPTNQKTDFSRYNYFYANYLNDKKLLSQIVIINNNKHIKKNFKKLSDIFFPISEVIRYPISNEPITLTAKVP